MSYLLFWSAPSAGYWQKGKPYLDAIEWIYIADRTTAHLAFLAGQGHVRTYPQSQDLAELRDKGFVVSKSGGPVFNLLYDSANADSPFGNLKERQAVTHAIDRAAMAKRLGPGLYEVTNQNSVPSHWSYNMEIKGYPYDPAKAKQLLAEAGYPNGFKTTLYASTATSPDYMEAVQGYLAKVGIDGKIQMLTLAASTELQQKGWKNGIINAVFGLPGSQDPSRAWSTFHSKSGRYATILHPPEVDQLLEQSLLELDLEKRKPMIQRLAKLMVDEHAISTPMYYIPGTITKTTAVKDLRLTEEPFLSWTPEDTWLSK
ncbi:MAG: hypothetical protein HY667_01915 [Chloroflexi bacterium]|nr:hypothetical protein [Chloroflexota bacterium]